MGQWLVYGWSILAIGRWFIKVNKYENMRTRSSHLQYLPTCANNELVNIHGSSVEDGHSTGEEELAKMNPVAQLSGAMVMDPVGRIHCRSSFSV